MNVFNAIVILLCLFLLYLIFIDGRKQLTPISKSNTLTLRGFAIVGIMAHHIAQFFPGLGLSGEIFKEIGYMFTGIFFFLSGYGNFISFQKIDGFKKVIEWTVKRVLRIYLSFLLVLIIAIIVFPFIGQSDIISVNKILKYVLTITLPTWTNWYPKVQIFAYLVFSFSFYCFGKNSKKGIYLLAGIILAYIFLGKMLGLPIFWWNSIACFVLGVIFAKNKITLLSKRKISNTIITFTLFILLIALVYINTKISLFGSIFCLISLVVSAFIFFISTLSPISSKFFEKLGEASLEIYLFHLIMIRIMQKFNLDVNISIALILIISLVGSLFIYKIIEIMQLKTDYILNYLMGEKKS